MPEFCDLALPVPLDMVFTYRLNGQTPVIGGRVLAPFRSERLAGIVTELHDRAPSMPAKAIHSVIDNEPVLNAHLLQLAEWISHYYLAPIGEVLRSMLPLSAEVRRAWACRICDRGEIALHDSAQIGASRRSKKDSAEQMLEYDVLDYLAAGDDVLESTLRSATGASRELLASLVRKKWITRSDVSSARDARRMVRYVVRQEIGNSGPKEGEKKLNANQQAILNALAACSGKMTVDDARRLAIPKTTLNTLVRRELVRIMEEPADFCVSTVRSTANPPSSDQLNPAQKQALDQILQSISSGAFSVSLLHGVTGSGKTAVYLCAMQAVLEQGRSAIMLVPEIGLTPAAAANLHRLFGDQVALLHSGLSRDERAQQWHRIHRGEARIVVGTRSAVFAPVCDLALLVVDEEHDSSYKQEEMPRYHGRDVAVIRGKLAQASVVLGSATPSLETYHNAQTGKYALIELRERVEQRPLPEVEIVDMRNEFQQTGEEQLFSRRLLEEIGERLGRSEQVIVLHNRRGYSAIVLCRACGETIQCRNCAIPLTHHKAGASALADRAPVGQRLECHYCAFRLAVPKVCPKCQSEYLYFLGSGSEKIEERLHGIFPQARIGRLDRDTVRGRHDFERVLNRLHAGEIDLLVGTQMIAKGHDIHGVTLVGVVGADSALGFPDFRAAESTFQLLAQVSGRAGRGNTPGRVVLQTYFPEHYAIQFAAAHDYAGFYEKEVRYRRWMHYPPFTSVTNILLRSEKANEVMRYAGILGRWFEKQKLEGIRVLGPAAAPIVRLKRDYRYHFILKAASRQKMNTTLRALLYHAAENKIPRTSIIVDVDALSLM